MNNKNKLLLSITILSSCAVMGTVLATGGAFNKSDTLAVTRGSEVWHHYAKVSPTLDHYGSKEFWAKDSEGCTVRYFDDPGVDCTEHDFSEYAEFATLTYGHELYIPPLKISLGIEPFDLGNDKLTYGLYPQSKISDDDLIAALNGLDSSAIGSNGWYLYDDAYYAKHSTFWYLCEPIVWEIISDDDNNFFLLSESILDSRVYYGSTSYRTIEGQTVYSNNYKHSDIRAWLNDDFYNSAFVLGSKYILTTVVNNSASTTCNNTNGYACDNTNDKVFLPSYRDYLNTSYGFPNDTDETSTRDCKPTAYALAMGVKYENYWTRSPANDGSTYASSINEDGSIYYRSLVTYDDFGVRPAITIRNPEDVDFFINNAVEPIDNGDGTFTYGIYPKTRINDASLLTSLNGLDDTYLQANGWYLYNGAYYSKKETDWFRCDAINWIVLNNYGNGEYLLLSENALDVHRYDDDSSNYETSEIRAFLNDETYIKAFHLNNSYVKTVNSNKLYILESYTMRDFFESGDNYPKRLCPLTDWLSANSAYSYGGNVCYWSSYARDGSSVYRFDTNGSSTGWESVSNETFCVRPAMTLKLS